jgi:cytochrome c-type biogenesis protein CcmH
MTRLTMTKMIAVLGLLCLTFHASAIDPLTFKDRAEEVRFQKLAAELRCMQCQNQSLADSDAQLAQDMRKLVLEQIQAGKSDQEVRSFFVERYGNFATYMPPVNQHTIWLWLLPLITALGGALWLIRSKRRTPVTSADSSTTDASPDAQNW